MKTKKSWKQTGSNGSVTVLVLILTAIACMGFTSVYQNVINFTTFNRKVLRHDKSLFYADSAIVAALVELRNGGDGNVSLDDSRSYFSEAPQEGTDWGFVARTSGSGVTRSIAASGHDEGSTFNVTATAAQNVSLQTIHSLYAFAIYAGNDSGDSNYVLEVGGSGTAADFVNGDVYSGNDVDVADDAFLRYPELYTDLNGDGQWTIGEEWTEFCSTYFSNALSQTDYDAYLALRSGLLSYGNGEFDTGEAFVDTVGNGVYDAGEPYVDVNGNGLPDPEDTFTDLDGDGVYDAGEPFTDRGNGAYDEGEDFEDLNGNGVWDAASGGYWTRVGWRWYWVSGTSAEPYEDVGNGVYDAGEEFVDRDGIYTDGDTYYDDRNGTFDYGTMATGEIDGMPSPATGYPAVTGGDGEIHPPDLASMSYDTTADVMVADGSYSSSGKIYDTDDPRHIFRKNPTDRSYTKISGKDDYFLEDPTDASYGNSHQYITVNSNGNDKVYYVDGNLYIHNGSTYDFMFRDPGTKMTIVANGNITISDEFWYNGGTDDPADMLVLIAMEDPDVADSGNIYLGDAQYGTGGDVHAMLYAENDFVDNNLDTSGQPYLSIYGNMSAGNHVQINRRDGYQRTRLDVTLDDRITDGSVLPPGLPGSAYGERSLSVSDEWGLVSGSWDSFSSLE